MSHVISRWDEPFFTSAAHVMGGLECGGLDLKDLICLKRFGSSYHGVWQWFLCSNGHVIMVIAWGCEDGGSRRSNWSLDSDVRAGASTSVMSIHLLCHLVMPIPDGPGCLILNNLTTNSQGV